MFTVFVNPKGVYIEFQTENMYYVCKLVMIVVLVRLVVAHRLLGPSDLLDFHGQYRVKWRVNSTPSTDKQSNETSLS
jgi:hypothetical protein